MAASQLPYGFDLSADDFAGIRLSKFGDVLTQQRFGGTQLALAGHNHADYDQRVARPKKITSKRRTVRARVKDGSLDLLDRIPFRDGDEVLVSISEPEAKDIDALRRAAGAWKGMIDADALIANIYADRLIATRPSPRV